MTVGSFLKSLSSVASGRAIDHLKNIVGGAPQFFTIPSSAITADITTDTLDTDMLMIELSGDIRPEILSADLMGRKLSLDLKGEAL